MIPISVALQAFLDQGAQTLCTVLKVTLGDGTIVGFTDHDADIDYDDGDGAVTYQGGSISYTRKDVAQSGDMTVDNSSYEGALISPSIDEADLAAGKWDNARVAYSILNYADTTMGAIRLPAWSLAEVTAETRPDSDGTPGGMYKSEIVGIMQAYARNVGELIQPGCRANLGDARCKVVLGPFTVTGTLTGVSADQFTLYDTSRTEPGPAGGIAVTGVDLGTTTTIHVADASTFSAGEIVAVSGIVGPNELNVDLSLASVDTGANTLTVNVDSSLFSAYVSGGTVFPLGGSSGYFAFGVCTITGGDNDGISRDVLSYVPGAWTLALRFPYDLVGNETYTMVAGCDKTITTCITRFTNAPNFRGEPYLPGIDQIVQVQVQP